jgi:uracil-DNA glycosylase family 4
MASCISPDKNCDLCPRLEKFRLANRKTFPDKFNAPVPAFGDDDPLLLIVGLAPGLKGANFSGRPFTGDYAGDLLYPTLVKFGFAQGVFGRHAKDGLTLVETRITNAVRCVPPENKPTGDEINACRPFLDAEFGSFKRLKAIVALGTVAHNSVLKSLGLPVSGYKFAHAAVHQLQPKKNLKHPVTLIDSYHCSRYNVNTGRLTAAMFEDAIAKAKDSVRRAKAA